jgi:branched-chain amino acid aminotransferase
MTNTKPGTRPAAQPGHVWVDGHLVPAAGTQLSVFDRGFQLGDGVFETLRVRGGHPTELAEHIARLRHSADGLGIELAPDLETTLAAAVTDLVAAEGMAGSDGDASVRITVSRGAFTGRGLLPPDEVVNPTIVVQAWPVVAPAEGHIERGIRLVRSAIRRDPENPLVALKTTSRADYVHARLEARKAGADDALFLTIDGFLSEATTANVFLVTGDELATPALACAILPGTTRSWILGWAGRVGLRPVEGWLTVRDIVEADEAFLCSSVAGIIPVTTFDGSPIGTGVPGPWTRRARIDREAFIRDGDGDRSRPAATDDRGLTPMTRAELIARTRQLVDEGERLESSPSLGALQLWLKLSDDLLVSAWGSMDRYHLSWLMVGKPKSIIRGRALTPAEEAAYVREVAAAKTAALRMSLDAVDRQGMPFHGEDGGVAPGQGMGEVPS